MKIEIKQFFRTIFARSLTAIRRLPWTHSVTPSPPTPALNGELLLLEICDSKSFEFIPQSLQMDTCGCFGRPKRLPGATSLLLGMSVCVYYPLTTNKFFGLLALTYYSLATHCYPPIIISRYPLTVLLLLSCWSNAPYWSRPTRAVQPKTLSSPTRLALDSVSRRPYSLSSAWNEFIRDRNAFAKESSCTFLK